MNTCRFNRFHNSFFSKTITSIRRYLLAQHSSFPLNGSNYLEQSIKTLSILSTRCDALDDILCSGVYTGEVTEFVGPSSSGKTQVASGRFRDDFDYCDLIAFFVMLKSDYSIETSQPAIIQNPTSLTLYFL